MKDMMGIELEPGQHIMYFRFGPGGIVTEDAEVLFIRKNSIRVEFLGGLSYGKKKGDMSNLYNTTGRTLIVDKDMQLERINFQNRIKELEEENNKLKNEAEKIHFRFDILDL